MRTRLTNAQTGILLFQVTRGFGLWLVRAMILIGLATVVFLLTMLGSTKGSLEFSVMTQHPSRPPVSQQPTPQNGGTVSQAPNGVVIVPLEK